MIKNRYILFVLFCMLGLPTHAHIINTNLDSLNIVVNSDGKAEDKATAYIDFILLSRSSNQVVSDSLIIEGLIFCKKNRLKKQQAEIELIRIEEEFKKGNVEQALLDISVLDSIVESLNDTVFSATHHYNLGIFYSDINKISEAMESALYSLNECFSLKDTLGAAFAYNLIGIMYDNIGDTNKALEYYHLSKDFALKSEGNEGLLSDVYNNIGIIYHHKKDFKLAIGFYNKAIQLSESSGNKDYYEIYINLALFYSDKNELIPAIDYLHDALFMAKNNDNIHEEIVISNSLADVYLKLNNFDSTNFYINQCLYMLSEIKSVNYYASVYYTQGELFFKQKFYDKAISSFTKSYHYARNIGFKDVASDAVSFMAKVEAARNNFELAYKYMLVEKEISDSILLDRVDEKKEYANLQVTFNNSKNNYAIDLAKSDLLIKLGIEKRQREKFTLLFVILVALLIIIFVIIYAIQAKKVSKLMVQKRREEHEKKALLEISNIELKEQHAFVETLLNTIPNPVFYTDKKNILIGCNIAFEDMTGMLEESMVGLELMNIQEFSGLSCPTASIFDNKMLSLQRSECEMILQDKSVHHLICYRKTIMHNGSSDIGSIGILNDITDVKMAEKSIMESEAKLREALCAKDKFFNIMAHDLKNPFNGIIGLSGIMKDNYASFSEKEVITNIGLISQASVRVYNLLENLLEWARAQSGTMVVSPSVFILHEPIQECLDLFSQIITNKKLTVSFDFEGDILVRADQNMILTVFRNLLSNATKFSSQNGKINIKLESNQTDVQITIEDTGKGISEENQAKLFRIDAPVSTLGTSNEKGTGLGLIIVNEFVKQNKGSIKVISEINKGTAFTFTLPLANKQ